MYINILVVFLIICTLNKQKINELFTYKQCNGHKPLGLHGKFIKNNNFERTSKDDWNLYLPCGYKYVESEISNLSFNESNKYVFGISGSDNIASKNNLWKIIKNHYGFEEACKIMPTTHLLYNKQDMEDFKKTYDKTKIYILKKNLQRKLGLKLVQNDLPTILKSVKDKYKVVQEYLEKPLLINGYKLNLRVYLIVVCSNKSKQLYLHKTGKCLYTIQKYNTDTLNFDTNITSYKQDKNIYNKNPLTYEQLLTYLEKNNYNVKKADTNVKDVMKKTSDAIKSHLCNRKKLNSVVTFQLFGVDILLDDNLNAKLLEINKGPNMIPINSDDVLLKSTIYNDLYKNVNILSNDNNGFIEL